ncbi:beta-adaptin-like protein C [Eucalyptus grandis]|uniref:beta-adaptin-like protein C n=1 Tax=Eucalyptus grandis TaxID=71139 RepID=UPI00192EF5F3|nr:beta-adaptin-like protein C [Eucalyptus grandis]
MLLLWAGCKDIDDALHYTALSNGNFEVDSKYGKDMDRYEEYSKAVPAMLVAAFTLSFVTKLNLQENMHLIDYVIASEWVQPQWLKFLFALLYNLSILFYRNKQVEEEQGFVRNGHADKWERVHQIRDKFEYDRENLCKKMAPLVTLLSAEPEIQYVALRNINLIVQRRPTILAHEIKVFFCKYNDPIYVKMEKLEIMIKLASDKNIDQVLLEFKECATEVDVDFVRKAVRAIDRCAIKLERAAERCISVLLELIKIKVNYVVQEAIIVIKDIFRRYPNIYESINATLCESLDTLDEPRGQGINDLDYW